MALLNPSRRITLLLIASLFSGAAALCFEALWTRAFSLILGSTVQAAAATFAAFLGGLALGAWFSSMLLRRSRRPLRAYICIELLIALSATAVGLLMQQYNEQLLALFSKSATEGMTAPRAFGVTLLLLGIPSILMGATFPVLVAAAKQAGATQKVVRELYFFNVLGGSVGALLVGFVLIRCLGVRNSLLASAALNVCSSLLAVAVLRATQPNEANAPLSEPAPEISSTHEGSALGWTYLAASFLSGFTILSFEILWTRIGGFFVGNRTYAMTLLLACAMLSLALGSILSKRLQLAYRGRVSQLLAYVLAGGALISLASIVAADAFIGMQDELESKLPMFPLLLAPYRSLEILLLMAPMLATLGVIFPTCLASLSVSSRDFGRAVGIHYIVNTLGSIAGSLLTGFWAVQALGTYGTATALIALLCLGSIVMLGAELKRDRSNRLALAVCGGASLLFVFLPSMMPERLQFSSDSEKLIFRKEDEYGVFQIAQLSNGQLSSTSNRTRLVFLLGSYVTSFVQQMQGHLGMMFNPQAKTALVLGNGYGITAGALSLYPGLSRVDAVEIIPGMIEAAELFSNFNFNLKANPKVVQIHDDGRHFLARSESTYDIITLNITDPHLPGGAALFHKEFYDVAKSHLNPGGVLLQHVFGSDLDIVLNTLRASFPHLRLMQSYANGFVVVASQSELKIDAGAIDRLVKHPPVAQALEALGLVAPLNLAEVVSFLVTEKVFTGPPRPELVATDDRPLIEFAVQKGGANMLFSNE